MNISVRHDVYIHFGDDLNSTLSGILLQLNQLRKEIEPIMPSIAEVKAAVIAKVAEVQNAVLSAVSTETAQVSAQIQALKDQIAAGGTISQADLDEILGSVGGITTAASTAIDAISTSDGANPNPPPIPVP